LSIRKEKEMTYAETITQRDKSEEYFVVELKKKPTQELRRFMMGSWTASILSPEEIEELYHELQRREASPRDGTEEYFVEMSQD
jgi:hypothetical protein